MNIKDKSVETLITAYNKYARTEGEETLHSATVKKALRENDTDKLDNTVNTLMNFDGTEGCTPEMEATIAQITEVFDS